MAKNGPKVQKNLSVSLYLRNRTSYDDFGFRYTWYVKWYLQEFFNFFQNLIFFFLAGGGGGGL